MTIDIQAQKEKLIDEKNKIEEELSNIAVKDEHGVWQAKNNDSDDSKADDEEMAEAATEFQANESFAEDLKNQLADINEALVNVELGSYGICVQCQQPIEEDRLMANPPAKTCKAHM
jgi:RNA polymerase-binding transcription factor DksA